MRIGSRPHRPHPGCGSASAKGTPPTGPAPPPAPRVAPIPRPGHRGSTAKVWVIRAWGPDRKAGCGGVGLTSWASGGRCPEASRGPACPWGTCPPTAPGGPADEGAWQVSPRTPPCPGRPALFSTHSPNLCSLRTQFPSFILGCQNSYAITNSQSQLPGETAQGCP